MSPGSIAGTRLIAKIRLLLPSNLKAQTFDKLMYVKIFFLMQNSMSQQVELQALVLNIIIDQKMLLVHLSQ